MLAKYKKDKVKILLVDTNEISLQPTYETLKRDGWAVEIIKGLKASYERVNKENFHLIVYWAFHQSHLFGQDKDWSNTEKICLLPKEDVFKAQDYIHKGANYLFYIESVIEVTVFKRVIDNAAEKVFWRQGCIELMKRMGSLLQRPGKSSAQEVKETFGSVLEGANEQMDLFNLSALGDKSSDLEVVEEDDKDAALKK